MDWFRWHHGSVTDPKFQLIARQSSATVAEVIAVWACILEEASKSERRGVVGQVDCEAMDCALGMPDGRTGAILSAMYARGILADGGLVVSWEKRQPKRERDDSSAERVREFRRRQAEQNQSVTDSESNVTPCNANETQVAPREEERREEENRKDQKLESSDDDSSPAAAGPVAVIAEVYHDMMTGTDPETGRARGCARIEVWAPRRKKKALAADKLAATLCKQRGWEYARRRAEFWRAYFAQCQLDPWLRGDRPNPNNPNWKQNLFVLIDEERFTAIMDKALTSMGAEHE